MHFNKISIVLGGTALVLTSGCLALTEPTEGEILARDFAAAVEADGAYGDTGVDAVAQIEAMEGERVTGAGDTPVGGSAEYTGQMGLGTPEDGVIGDMTVTVGFAGDGSFDGDVTDFVDEDGEAVAGELSIGNGAIDMTVDPEEKWQIYATVEGTVDLGDGEESINASLNGEFLGAGAAHATGEITTDVTDAVQTETVTVGYFGVSR